MLTLLVSFIVVMILDAIKCLYSERDRNSIKTSSNS